LLTRSSLVALFLLAVPSSTLAQDAGHVSLALSSDNYGSDAFRGGRDGSGNGSTLNGALVAQYVRDPTGPLSWLPTLGVGIGRWNSSLEGNCCGFSGSEVNVELTNLDLLLANLDQRGNIREVWYLLGGVSSVDVGADFNTAGVEGVSAERQSAFQLGFGFFAGRSGGFTGGFELRHTRLPDFDITTARITVGIGF